MDWTSNLFIVLLLTDVTGTIFFLIGRLFKKYVSDDVGLLHFLTKVTLCTFLVPFVYIVLYMDKRIRPVRIESDINLFYNTPLTLELGAVLGCIWFGLFLILLTHRLYRRFRWAMVCRGNIPEEDEVIFRVFTETCAEFGIGGEVSVCRNDSVWIPCITYHHGFVVILPLVKYTEEDARIIFCHELCHYLNRDMYLKTIGCIVAQLHVFNPAAHILLKEMDLLCEERCDRVACEKGKSIFTRAEYFRVVLESLVTDGKRERYQLFKLVDDKTNYERRVDYMMGYHKNGGIKKGTALVLSVCFLLGSGFTSLAAGSGVTVAYEELAKATSVKNVYVKNDVYDENKIDGIDVKADLADKEALQILSKAYNLNPENVIIMEDDGIELHGDVIDLTWTIPEGKTYMSTGFTQGIGDKVTATVVGTPDDIDYEMGLKDPKQIMWYVEGSGATMQEFEIEIKGRHYFFVSNLSETEELHVVTTIIRTPAETEEQ